MKTHSVTFSTKPKKQDFEFRAKFDKEVKESKSILGYWTNKGLYIFDENKKKFAKMK